MKTTEFTFLSQDGKTPIHAVRWEPDDGKWIAVLQITHGMVEYIQRYAAFAEYLTQHGFLVVGHDHLGHGKSVSDTVELGYFSDQNPSDVVVADIHQLRQKTQKENPGLPYFMLGHSMGSFMLRKYLARYGKGLSGAIIMGTGYIAPTTNRMGLSVVRLLTVLMGAHHRSPLVQKFINGPSYRGFDTTGKDPAKSWLSRDTEMVRKYYADPYCTFTFTLNGFRGLFEAAQFACKPENANRIPKALPLLLVSGGNDPVGDHGTGVELVYQMYQEAGIQDLDCILYEGARHEVLNEVNRAQVYEDLYRWLYAHVEAEAGRRHFPPVVEE